MTSDLEQRLREALDEDAARARLVNPLVPPAVTARALPVGQDPRPSWRRFVAVAAVLALIVAAGVAVTQNGDRGPDVSTFAGDPKERAIAEGAVLTADDLPTGWVVAPAEDEEQRQAEEDDHDQAIADCLGVDVSVRPPDEPTAESAFVNSNEANPEHVVSEVTVFGSETEAREALARFGDQAAQQCYLDVFEPQIAEEARGGLTTISGRALSVDEMEIGTPEIDALYLEYLDGGSYRAVGDNYLAFRINVPITAEGVEVDVYVELAFLTKGRVAAELSTQTYFTPFDGDGTSTLVAPRLALLAKKVVDRIPAVSGDKPGESVDEPADDPADEPANEPVTLPEPGEQPADPEAAEEEVRAAFTGLFDASVPREDRAQFVDRPEVWLPLNKALFESEWGVTLRDLHAVVDAVVFTSPTHASVRFQLLASDPIVPGDYVIGDALLLDGRWVVDVTTPCSTAQATGITCDFTP